MLRLPTVHIANGSIENQCDDQTVQTLVRSKDQWTNSENRSNRADDDLPEDTSGQPEHIDGSTDSREDENQNHRDEHSRLV